MNNVTQRSFLCLKTRVLSRFALFGWFLFAGAASVCGDNPPPTAPETVRAHADRVVVPINLRTAAGEPLPNDFSLTDFDLFVDGKAVPEFSFLPEKESPAVVGLLVDRQSKTVRKRAPWLRQFVEGLIYAFTPDDAFFIASFGSDYAVIQPRTTDRARLQELVYGMCQDSLLQTPETRAQDRELPGGPFGEKVSNKTAIAVDKGLRDLRESGARRTLLVVVTDGDENLSRITLRNIQNAGRPVFAVCFNGSGFGRDSLFRRGRMARRLAEESGGLCTVFEGGMDPVAQAKALAAAAHSQVVLAFDPDPSLNREKSHDIRVACRRPNVQLLYRRSFLLEK